MISFQYPYWPGNNPFHPGEDHVQKLLGTVEAVAEYAPKFIRPFMPDQHREFFCAQPFLVAAARDRDGNMWSTILTDLYDGSNKFIKSPSSTRLSVQGQPAPGDALEHAFQVGDDVGLLAIEFATKRRNRVNGRIISGDSQKKCIEFMVEQSFGNCPQYIQPRQWWRSTVNQERHAANAASMNMSTELTPAQIEKIRAADTIFVATGYRGEGEDARYGNDASHRGGTPGWVHVENKSTLLLPDFSGNGMFNTLGNIHLDPRMGITIPNFESGGLLQLTGIAKIVFDRAVSNNCYPGSQRLIEFTISKVNQVEDSALPIRWNVDIDSSHTRKLQVVYKTKESTEITSFHLKAADVQDPVLWKFIPGQHLPIQMAMSDEKTLLRSYSLSGGSSWGEYRISVKREPFGEVSSYLHDNIKVGDTIQAQKPTGDFILDNVNNRTLVLLSAGVGVTPILSMLHEYVDTKKKIRRAVWLHGTQNGEYHAFQSEIQGLIQLAGNHLTRHIAYSRPREEDHGLFDSKGRLTPGLVKEVVPDFLYSDIYMCGPSAFCADMEEGLLQMGVDPKYIHFETF